MQPFDSKSLLHLLNNDNVNKDDFKFISWKDFDVALESDTELLDKLYALSNMEHSIATMSEKLVHSEFMPLDDGRNVDDYYYRVDRNGKTKSGSNNLDVNEEKLKYQL